MAITLNSLIPEEDDVGILLSSSLSFTLDSDDEDLDPDTFIFKMNGINVEPDIEIVSPVQISISRLLSDLEYGQKYVCSVEIEDVIGTTFSDTFPFTMEEGTFVNTDDLYPKYKYFQTTQELANNLPEDKRARYDRYSTFQQFLNKPAGQIEEFDNFLYRQISSYYLQTCDLNSLSRLYKVLLPGSYNFPEVLLDNGDVLIKPPTVYGYSGLTKFEVIPSFTNDLSSFYYQRLPTRISTSSSQIANIEILPWTDIDSDPVVLNFELERLGGFIIEIAGGSQFTYEVTATNIKLLSCVIKGQTIFNKSAEEVISFVENGFVYTKRQWKSIESIEFFNIPAGFEGTFRLDHFKPINAGLKDFRFYSNLDNSRFITWKLSSNMNGSLLSLVVDHSTSILDKLRDPSTETIREVELLDVDNYTNLSLIDFAINEYSDYFYAVDDTYLYVFDKIEDYPPGLRNLAARSTDPQTVINLQTDELARVEGTKEIQFAVAQLVLGKKIVSYQFKILNPDGSILYILQDGSTSLTQANTFTFVSSDARSDFKSRPIKYLLDNIGDYYLTLTTRYNDGTYDRDVKVIRVFYIAAKARYKLLKYLGEETPVRLFIDFDQKLKILDSGSNLVTVNLHRDSMLIDYRDKVLYFNENYDKVDVDGI